MQDERSSNINYNHYLTFRQSKGLMKMKTLICIAYIIIVFVFFYKVFRKNNKYKKNIDNLRLMVISEHIDMLSTLKNNLNDIEQMITDLQICTPRESATAFKLYMHTNNTSVDILADSASENILALLEEERKKLRSTLYLEIKNLYDRCNENCNGNNKVFNKNQSGEWLL